MKHSRLIPALAVGALAATTLVGCIPLDESASDEASISIGYWVDNNEQDAAIKSIVADFEAANPGIVVEPIRIEGQVDEKIAALIAGGDPPTVLMTSSGSLPGYAPAFTPLDLDTSVYLSSAVTDALTFEGQLYAAPFIAKPKVIAVNVAAFEAAGLDLPATDEPMTPAEFAEIAIALTSGDGESKTYGSDFLQWNNWLTGFGGGWYNSDATACTIGSPEAIAAADFMVDGFITDGFALPLEIWSEWGFDQISRFGGGQIGMLTDIAPKDLSALKALGPDVPWMLVPVVGAGAELEVNGLGLTTTGTEAQQAAGRKLIEYISMSGEGQSALAADGLGFLPVIDGARATFLAQGTEEQHLQAFFDALGRIVPRVNIKNDQPVRGATQGEMFTQMPNLLGTPGESANPAEALPQIEEFCTTTLAELSQ